MTDLKVSGNEIAIQDFQLNLSNWKKSSQNISPFRSGVFKIIPGETGQIIMKVGPMGSGKSTRCIEDNKIQKLAEKIPVVLVYRGYEREGFNPFFVTTHRDKTGTLPVFRVNDLEEFEREHPEEFAKCHVIQIEEFNFFGGSFITTLKKWMALGYEIIVYGLNGSFERKQFGAIGELFSLSSKVVFLEGLCGYCKIEPSCYSDRMDKENKKEKSEGGIGRDYMPCCRKCWYIANPTERIVHVEASIISAPAITTPKDSYSGNNTFASVLTDFIVNKPPTSFYKLVQQNKKLNENQMIEE
jgi:thymidine kinase